MRAPVLADSWWKRTVFGEVADLYDRARPGYPEQLVEAGPSRTASRARVRALLAPFLCRDGYLVERLDTARTTIETLRA